ncbi:YsnF/AvaK domain-containing protein [Psychrobacter raelei]|uniref:YsnF/AvaK domain-containing protein n=1 Tax=Psychrobacter raelei TaxID=2565531 RepID=UPI003F60953A
MSDFNSDNQSKTDPFVNPNTPQTQNHLDTSIGTSIDKADSINSLPDKATPRQGVTDLSHEDNLQSHSSANPNGQRTVVGSLELLEERAVVDKERLDIGKVKVRKEVRRKTVNVPIELMEEILVIETDYYDADSRAFLTNEVSDEDIVRHIEPTLDSQPSIMVNGNQVLLDSNEPLEIVISRQVALIKKETHAVQDVRIEKSTHLHQDTFEVELKHEELDVQEEGFFEHERRKR